MKPLQAFAIFFVFSFALIAYHISKNKNQAIKVDKQNTAAESLGSWTHARTYPGNRLNTRLFQQAFEEYQTKRLKRTTAFAGQWEAIGPKNFGGRTLCLAFNPNSETIYAGSASGGLWRSYTGGVGADAWHPVPTGFPVIGVGAIAIHPNDSNTIYIGTGEVYNYQNTGTGFAIRVTRGTYGIGILKSTDGGLTWTQSLPWQLDDLTGVQDIIINPLDPSTVFAATSEGTFKSYDEGATWIQCHSVLMATDINYMPGDTSVILLAAGNSFSLNSGIYRSTDGGNSFVRINNGLPSSWSGKTTIDFSQSQPNIAYASIANQQSGIGLYKTTNGGISWAVVNTLNYATYQGWYSHDVAVRPDDPNRIICAGVDAYNSVDGGVNLVQASYWQNWDFNATTIGGVEGQPDYIHADIHRIYWSTVDHDVIYFATDGGIFRSINNAISFEGCNGMYQTQQFYANFSNSHQDSLFALGGMQDNATAVYEGNLGWRRVIGGDGISTAINPLDDNIVYGESQYLNLAQSTTHAGFFMQLNLQRGNVQNFAAPFVICHSNPDVLYAGSDMVEKTTDGGFNWTYMNNGMPLDGNPILVLEASRTDEDIVYAATSPVIIPQVNLYKTVDGGNTWTDVTAGLPNRYIMDVAIDPNNNLIVYVAISGFGTDHIYKSIDGGATWNASGFGLPDVPTNTICIDPSKSNTIYVGNDIGVFVSLDGGATWDNFNLGLYDATLVMDISISPVNRKLRIATHGKGVYERVMLPLTVGIPSATENSFEIKVSPNPANDYIEIVFNRNPDEYVNIKLFDPAGKLLKTFTNITVKKFQINMGGYTRGTYILKIESRERSGIIRVIKH